MLFPEAADQIAHLDDLLWVQTNCGFVQNDDLRVSQQRLRQTDALLIAF